MPYQPGQMYNPQQAAFAGAQAAATPWAQYPYQQAYGAAAAQVSLSFFILIANGSVLCLAS